jgi:hypothetical protein
MKSYSCKAGAAALVAILTLLAFGVCATRARATGTVTIRQNSGGTNTYSGAEIKIIHSALYVTSADGRGTLVINRAACAYQGQLMVCLPTSAALVQAGKTSPLDFESGTVYYNGTDDFQPMALTTAKVPPHSILLSFSTKRGTYVSVRGRIDNVVK